FAADPPRADDKEMAAARAELERAREELRDASRRVATLSAKLGSRPGERAFAYRFLSDEKRALVGVVLAAGGNGVKLAAVTPGGPAEKAGLRAGDRIVAINGKAVPTQVPGTAGTRAPTAKEQEAAVEAARGLIGELEPGETVRFTYEREGKRGDVTVAAERRTSWEWPVVAGAFAPEFEFEFGPEFERDIEVIVERSQDIAANAARDAERMRRQSDRIRRNVIVMRDGSLSELRLAALNPELGRYFGTQSGVLVLERGDESFVQLKPGDVIVSVDGTPVEDTRDVMRALVRKGAGQVANVEVVRDKRRQVLVVEVPEDAPILIAPPLPPHPPHPPHAPAAPRAMPAPHALPAPAPAPPAPAAPPAPPEPREPGKLARIIDGTQTI
ncbi:MAG TPA: PDZ domain-containing protein, partial [Xanthomonadales bacterium]|nr:PDZ domain-containing protein [Xanthomonadales bacterium]